MSRTADSGCPTTTVLPSVIQGLGVFAAEAFSKNTVLLKLDDSRPVDDYHPLQPELGESKLHLDFLPDGSVILMKSPERYLNHSCEPNCYLYSADKQRFLLPIRDIVAQEELLVDYAINAINGDEWECQCGASRCRRLHKCDFFTLPGPLQLEYLPFLDPWFAGIHSGAIKKLLNAAY